MTRLVDLQGEPLPWPELHRRNAQYWATHDRSGELVPGPPGRAVGDAMDLPCGLEGLARTALGTDGDPPASAVTPDAGGATTGTATRRGEDLGFHAPIIPERRF